MADSINTPSPLNASARGDQFVAQLRNMSIRDLSIAFDALWQHMDILTLYGRRGDSQGGAFDVLHAENDSRLKAIAEEMKGRHPEADEHLNWSRTLANYAMLTGG